MSHPTIPSARPRCSACRLRTALLALAALLAALAMLLLGGLWYIKHMDWNAYKPSISDKALELMDRPLRIGGDLTVDWHWPDTSVAGWHSWIPSLTITALDVVVGNPTHWPEDHFSDPGDFLEAQQAQAHVQLLPLLSHTLQVDLLQLTGAYGRFQRSGDVPASESAAKPQAQPSAPVSAQATNATEADNWHFHAGDTTSGNKRWHIALRELQFNDSTISYENQPLQLFVRARFSPTRQAPYQLAFTLKGRSGKAPLQGQGMVGNVLHIQNTGQSLPLQLQASAGDTRLSLEGMLHDPLHLGGLDVQLDLASSSLQQLSQLTGLNLPATPAFQVKGQLQGGLAPHRAQWTLQAFSGQVGSGDIGGDLHYSSGTERPQIKGALHSRQLHLVDFGALAATSAPAKGKARPRILVLPQTSLPIERWRHADADISLAADTVIRKDAPALEQLNMTVKLDNGMMRIDPLSFNLAGGSMSMPLVVDAQRTPVRAEVHAKAQGVKLAAFLPATERSRKNLGALDGSIQLAGTGDSVAAMLGNANGSAKLYVSSGTISKQVLDMAAMNLGSIVVARFFGANKEVPIRCMAADFQVKNGVAHASLMRLSAADAYIDGSGTIDLRREQVQLQLKPMSTDWKLFTLRSPLLVSGPLAHPQVQLQSSGLLARAGAALAAVVAAPAALAVLPLTAAPVDDPTDCARLQAAARQ